VRALLLVDGSGVSIVSAAVAALVVIFLTLPMVFLLADHARRRNAGAAPETKAWLVPVRSRETYLTRRKVPASRAVEIVESTSVPHDFADEPLPRTIGLVRGDVDVEGDLVFQGYLQVGERVRILGRVETGGSLALASGAVVEGDARSRANVHVGRGVVVHGEIRAGGDVRCAPFASVGRVNAEGALLLEGGATARGGIRASRVERPLQAGDIGVQHPDSG
jgi:cytoskeletal protein CcmA (bactofilin family)